MRQVVVRRLLALDEAGMLESVHVRIAAETAGVSVRTAWRWLARARKGQTEPVYRRGGFMLAARPEVPKLLAAFEPGPGAMTDQGTVAWCEENIAGLEVSRHGLAGHHSPEDRPEELAAAINAWADRHGLARQ
ncbi:hypothetical protein [Streptomyces sp. NPDC057582]|uniref:hypothetical protein n=1 Tax=Streptomyces sp. NPDC057582 TaxID=3346174 RepID=UPI00368143ED